MKTEIVLKPFNSTLRRFREGDPVSERDDFAPHTYRSLKERHFIGEPKVGTSEVPFKPARAAKRPA